MFSTLQIESYPVKESYCTSTEFHYSVSHVVYHYNKTVSQLLDKHAPLRKKTITIHPQTEWYTPEL